jgi:hypothetical protein
VRLLGETDCPQQAAASQPLRRDMMNTKRRALAADTARASHIDNLLDEALKQTFPASDPIAIAVEAVHVPYAGPSGTAIRLN